MVSDNIEKTAWEVDGRRVVILHPNRPVRRTILERLKSRPFDSLKVQPSPMWQAVNQKPEGLAVGENLYCTLAHFHQIVRLER